MRVGEDIVSKAEHEGRVFKIVADLPEVGFYLYVYEGDRDTHDYLQDTVEMCKRCALEHFGVPMSKWSS